MAQHIHPVILCGGSGTRLWPLSTPERPKQFLALTSSRSLIAETALRFESSHSPSISFSKPLVVGSKRHASLLETHVPNTKKILEPIGRNSAPAVTAACLAHNADDLILILPADHDIQDVPAFHSAIEKAAAATEDGAIVTFGIEPTHPATGYGYIKARAHGSDVLDVEAFVEKPDFETANAYVSSGRYYWNAGIFLFRAETMLEALNGFAPDILQGVKNAMTWKDGDQVADLDEIAFANVASISIDYAIMEKANNIRTVPVRMGWSDVGGYEALHELVTEKPEKNYTHGPVFAEGTKGLYVRSEGPTVAVNGVSDLVIIATENEVMIAPKSNRTAPKSLGATVRSSRHALGLSPPLIQSAKDWLWTAFETWSRLGWDKQNGGFVEQLQMNGEPDYQATRRVRVQARQVFCFAKAIELNWPNRDAANSVIKQGVAYIDSRLRHLNGGFVHLIEPDGRVIDDRRDLYDHSFIILAGSAAFRATGNLTALKIANDAFSYINAELKDEDYGGWVESSLAELPRRANSHMHLLEALLEYYSATGSKTALHHAAEVVRLFETKFFSLETDTMAEFFNADWSTSKPKVDLSWEPGHHYEWASLLNLYSTTTGHDSLSFQRRLIKHADQNGLNADTGFAVNALKASGEWISGNSRLWHQLERVRAYFLHRDVVAAAEIDKVFQRISTSYLNAGPVGGWIDELDHQGAHASQKVPASMLYHAVTALSIPVKGSP